MRVLLPWLRALSGPIQLKKYAISLFYLPSNSATPGLRAGEDKEGPKTGGFNGKENGEKNKEKGECIAFPTFYSTCPAFSAFWWVFVVLMASKQGQRASDVENTRKKNDILFVFFLFHSLMAVAGATRVSTECTSNGFYLSFSLLLTAAAGGGAHRHKKLWAKILLYVSLSSSE